MHQRSGSEKTTPSATSRNTAAASAGSAGATLMPPAYGIAMADHPAVQAGAGAAFPNQTGLPDALKAGMERLSGLALDDVRVHYNSPKPAHLQALAYTRGTDIHVAPGQQRHLPHEAWHVVQQKQGRVRPTLLAKGLAVNADGGLEHEADVRGAKAARGEAGGMLAATSGARIQSAAKGNPQSTLPVVQRIAIKNDNGVYHPATHPTGIPMESDDLTSDERKTAAEQLEGTALLTAMQQGWRAAAQNVDPVVTAMASPRLSDSGTKAKATRLYRASQNAGGTVSALLQAQQEWQDFLDKAGVSKEAVLSVHRSFGLEYEFATWELINPRGAPVQSHTQVGKSADFSAFFGVPFVLETDAQQELELVVPPLLAGEAAGGVNTAFMRAAHQLLIAKLVQIRGQNINTRVDQLPFENEGIGSNWAWIPAARLVRVAARRQKWADKPNQVAYQLNVVLTPSEIAAEIARVQDQALDTAHGDLYKTIRGRFLRSTAFRNLTRPRKDAVQPAILILAKGLSNSIAIPTLRLVAETRSPWPRNDLHSKVKDLHALWIKDSVPNAAVAAVQDQPEAKADFAAILAEVRSGHDLIPRDVLTSIPPYEPQGAASTENARELLERLDAAERGSTALKKAAEDEARACLDEVRDRLAEYRPQPRANDKPEFLKEAFGSGSGVRKDTYANVGRSRQSTLHLAEFRSVASTDAFLG